MADGEQRGREQRRPAIAGQREADPVTGIQTFSAAMAVTKSRPAATSEKTSVTPSATSARCTGKTNVIG